MLKNLIRAILIIRRLLKEGGYLKETGWINSIRKRQSIDKNNIPIPWVTYPFLGFIKDRLSPSMTLFEYGSGNSTLFWAEKLKFVASVEHDRKWFDKMKPKIPLNVKYKLYEIGNGYVESIQSFGMNFDIIFIDGRERVACIKLSYRFLNPDGVIIWDNSLREKYKEGIVFLKDQGFRQIDFKGLNPLGTVDTVTSVFYRQTNCLNI